MGKGRGSYLKKKKKLYNKEKRHLLERQGGARVKKRVGTDER